MHQTTHFFNLGYGWLCKHCSAEAAERKHHHQQHGAERRKAPRSRSGLMRNTGGGLSAPAVVFPNESVSHKKAQKHKIKQGCEC